MISPTALRAGVIRVTNLNDGGLGSLRAGIVEASPGDTLKCDLTGTIALTNGELAIDKELTILGPGANALTISGNHNGRVLNVSYPGSVSMSGLTIRDGSVGPTTEPFGEWWGGGIANGWGLTLTDCRIMSNSVMAAEGYPASRFLPGGPGGHALGGGIYNRGQLTLIRCEIVGNSSIGGDGGIGSEYGAGGDGGLGFGGGIANEGMLILDQCTLFGNSARGGSGGSAQYGGGYGGDGEGGAIADLYEVTISRCTFFANSARGGDGGGAQGGGSGGGAWGGGIYSYSRLFLAVTISLSTVCSNSAYAGHGAFKGGAEGTSEGGGLFFSDISADLSDCTIDLNTACSGGGMSAGSYTTVRNTIIAGNTFCDPPFGGGGRDCRGAFTSRDFNLIGRTNGCDIEGQSDHNIYGEDPLLGALQDNGGPTWTQALLPGSPAIDGGDSLQLIDERGGARNAGVGVDIGAFQVGGYSRLISVTRTNNDIQLRFTSDTGGSYQIERAPVLGHAWNPISDILPGMGVLIMFTDTNAALQPRRLYRVHLGQ